MVAAPFRYERVSSFDEAVRALRERGEEAKVIAGGQSLVPMLNLRVARPDWLIDINPIGAGPIEDAGGHLRLPALTRHRALERAEVVRRRCPILAAATRAAGRAGRSAAASRTPTRAANCPAWRSPWAPRSPCRARTAPASWRSVTCWCRT
jgi:CO/xanthine dehydrogenase FAD-binding subunit